MTESSRTQTAVVDGRPESPWAHPVEATIVNSVWHGRVTATRAMSDLLSMEKVFVGDESSDVLMILSPEETADLAEALLNVSGMACSTAHAPYLAEVHRENLLREGVTQRRACDEAGITRYRLRKILSGEKAMTVAEHKALSGLGARS